MQVSMLRQQMKEILKRRHPEDMNRISQLVIQRFLDKAGRFPDRWKGLRVALYRAIPGEFDLSPLDGWLRSVGSLIYYPKIIDQSLKHMEFIEVRSNSSWEKGAYGIEEPVAEAPFCEPSSLRLIFVPGLAFGLQGERIGRGAGYYDRFLTRSTSALKVSLTFDEQLFPVLEQNTWDQPIDWVLTESREVISPSVLSRTRKWFFPE